MTNAERQKRYRERNVTRTVTESPEGVTPVTVGGSQSVTVGLDDYLSRPKAYATRLEPDKLNWGEWMDSEALERAGLKANRVPVPGDWDYASINN